VLIRFASLRDAPAIAAIYAPIVEHTAISFETVPPDAAEIGRRIAALPADKPYLVAEIDGRVVGYSYASAFRGRPAYRFGVEVTVYIAADARRLGAGRRLYGALFALLRRQGYRRAFAGIALPNAGSIALHRAFGFTDAGVWHAAGLKFRARAWPAGRSGAGSATGDRARVGRRSGGFPSPVALK
jgi:L-amino acid N-acyltransferase YncA